MSQINTSNIDASFPKQGQDNPSGGFRENFSAIKLALDNAAQEITALPLRCLLRHRFPASGQVKHDEIGHG